jgi:TfoX/Sxy family transcriptional regulator of competence genes
VIALAETVVLAAEIYLGIGLAFAILFAWRGAAAVDPAAKDATLGFRLLIVPASALLWPLLLRRWWRRSPPPAERNAHRDAAAAAPARDASRAEGRP